MQVNTERFAVVQQVDEAHNVDWWFVFVDDASFEFCEQNADDYLQEELSAYWPRFTLHTQLIVISKNMAASVVFNDKFEAIFSYDFADKDMQAVIDDARAEVFSEIENEQLIVQASLDQRTPYERAAVAQKSRKAMKVVK